MKEALLYQQLSNNTVRCNLCSHHCKIDPGQKGICRVRINKDGRLLTTAYGRTIVRNVDPIEKKPLYHFYPGSRAFSVATCGCNFRCSWCQNWEIAQINRSNQAIMGKSVSPEEIVTEAREKDCRSIAYTYTEPTIFFEYAQDISKSARKSNLNNIFVTNGYMTADMLKMLQPCLDAANVDLKAFKDDTYKRYVGAHLNPVLESMKIMKQMDIWLEVTTLLIPEINDSEEEMKQMAHFIASELGVETPWHISRFYPSHNFKETPPTPVDKLYKAQEIGVSAGLRYLYIGNLLEEINTYCHACGKVLIKRSEFKTNENNITTDGKCPVCESKVAGVGIQGKNRVMPEKKTQTREHVVLT